MQVLLFAFHPEESAILSVLLSQAGFEVHLTKHLKPFVENWPEQPLDLICAALNTEHEKEISAIRQFRGQTVVPIVVIIEPISEDAEIALLDAGVDLIITRPFGFRSLIAKIRALQRRTSGLPYHSLPVMKKGSLILDPSNRTVKVLDNDAQKLTQLEFRLLYVLITHSGQIIPTNNIVEHVWGYSGEENRELVRGLVQRLRSKVEIDKRNPKYILTERGIGYYFNAGD